MCVNKALTLVLLIKQYNGGKIHERINGACFLNQQNKYVKNSDPLKNVINMLAMPFFNLPLMR